MKYLIALSAVILAASAMPAEPYVNKEPGFTDATVLISNGTRSLPHGQVGFATMNGGTTGGAGGAVWTVWDPWALRDAVSGNDRRIIYVRGRIDLTELFENSPGVAFRVGRDKTIIGGDPNAMIFGGGLSLNGVRNVIIQNIKFHNALSYAPGERPDGIGGIANQISGPFSHIDAIEVRASENVWIDHCEFADDPWNIASLNVNRRRHDGHIDIVWGANHVSVSNSIFRNHMMVTLIGNDDTGANDRGRLRTTLYHNWYQGTLERHPMVRYGEVHVLNNYYTGIRGYGIGVWTGARIYAERNMFIDSRRSWGMSSRPNPNPMGNLLAINNWQTNSPNDSGVPNNIGWLPSQYYQYTPMSNSLVGDHVTRHAGTW